jgi:phosphotransferase system enzyme I (PtsI)
MTMANPQILQGIAVNEGFITAKAYLLVKPDLRVSQVIVEDIHKELIRFQDACFNAIQELQQLIRDTKLKLGQEKAAIFEAQLMMVSDPDFINKTNEKIELEAVSAEAALDRTIQEYTQIFEAMDDEYLKERQKDIQDIGRRILCHLLGVGV